MKMGMVDRSIYHANTKFTTIRVHRPVWNKGRIVRQKRLLSPKHVCAIRARLEIAKNHRDFALFIRPSTVSFEDVIWSS